MSLISNMAANSQQFVVRTQNPIRPVHEVSVSSSIDRQLASLTQVVQSLATSMSIQIKPCGICSTPGHPTDMCPSLQDGAIEHANALGLQGNPTFQGPSRPKHDPYSPTYNLEWHHHPNLSYFSNNQSVPPPPQHMQQIRPQGSYQP